MTKVFCLGEALIDFIPVQRNTELKNVTGFERAAGGAPMNVAIAVAKYGGQAAMITKIATDHFGDYLVDILQEHRVDTSYIVRSKEGETGLAFVSIDKTGERSFTFYRKNAADILLNEKEIESNWFYEGDILHFGSVNLIEEHIRSTHIKAIESCRKNGGMISFDPNVRLPLWPEEESCRQAIRAFLPMADLVKISDDELFFITEIEDQESAIASLFTGYVKAVLFTKGKDGASVYLKSGERFDHQGFQVQVEDTTGAGDAFIGGFLAELIKLDFHNGKLMSAIRAHYENLLAFANASGALTTSVKGAIHAGPGKEQIMDFISKYPLAK